jgi:hypothetical protein
MPATARLFGRKRVFSVVHVSATHVATLAWHVMWGLQSRGHVVPLQASEQLNATFDQVQPIETELLEGDPEYLPAGVKGKVLLESQKVAAFIQMLQVDLRPYRLAMLSLTRLIDGQGSSNSINAQDVLNVFLPNICSAGRRKAAGLVIRAGRLELWVYELPADPASRAAGQGGAGAEAAEAAGSAAAGAAAGGAVVGVQADEATLRCGAVRHKLPMKQVAEVAGTQRQRRMTVYETIDFIDDEAWSGLGPDMPLLAVGYGCVTRCLALRGSKRVITYAAVLPTDGDTTANMQQMAGRPLGDTVLRRLANNSEDSAAAADAFMEEAKDKAEQQKQLWKSGQEVTEPLHKIPASAILVLMRRDDLVMFQHLYSITAKAIEVSCTGDVADIREWQK